MEDLQIAYQALEVGQEPQLPEPTATFAAWARNLDALARSPELTEDIAYWTTLAKEPIPSWPLDHEDGDDCLSSEEIVVVGLGKAETTALRKVLPREHRLSLNDGLLAALLQGFTEWSGQSSMLVDLVARGREMGGDELDLSRAIGRFSMTSPRLVHRPETPGPRALLDRSASRSSQCRGGASPTVCSATSGRTGVADALAPLGKPAILLNNWGEFVHDPRSRRCLGPPSTMCGRCRSCSACISFRSSPLRGGRVAALPEAQPNLNDRASIERLADLTLAALRSFVPPAGA